MIRKDIQLIFQGSSFWERSSTFGPQTTYTSPGHRQRSSTIGPKAPHPSLGIVSVEFEEGVVQKLRSSSSPPLSRNLKPKTDSIPRFEGSPRPLPGCMGRGQEEGLFGVGGCPHQVSNPKPIAFGRLLSNCCVQLGPRAEPSNPSWVLS